MQSLLLLPLLLAAPAQEPILAPTQLDRVTVYQSRALVERVVDLEAASPGPQVVVVGPLPLSIDETSLQTKVEGGSVRITMPIDARDLGRDRIAKRGGRRLG